MGVMSSSPAESAPRAWVVIPPEARETRFWSLSPEERLRRSLCNAGCAHVEPVAGKDAVPAPESGSALLFRGDVIFDPRLVEALLAAPDTLLWAPLAGAGPGGAPIAVHVDAARFGEALALLSDPTPPRDGLAGLRRVAPDELVPTYIASLRKAAPPYVIAARPEAVAAIESQIFGAAYKSVTDLITKWAWPVPAAAVTRALARRGVHPNTVTVASWILAIGAALLFADGRFGLGLVTAWAMTFLDTVDGKLARVTLTSSRVGHVLDHSLDLIHPPFWYLAWGLGATGGFDAATAVVVIGYLVGRLLEGVFLLTFSMETFCWRPIDTLFRTITARRNPNLILLTVGALAGAPDLGMVMVAIWTVVCIGFHSVRLVQASVARMRGETITPWDEAPAVATRPTETARTQDARAKPGSAA
jgi:phosphatidylglycerophosphate synthase